MKAFICAFSIALALSASASAGAKTASGTIPVTETVNSGSTVSAYLTSGDLTTSVQPGVKASLVPAGSVPVVRVSFDLERSWFLVKRVTWDRSRKHLTIDF
jgi:hypothetical protein